MKTIAVFLAATVLLAAACSSDSKSNVCEPEAFYCEANTLRKCTADGTNSVLIKVCEEQCASGECVSISKNDAIADGQGAQDLPDDGTGEDGITCKPGTQVCVGNESWLCGENGVPSELLAGCIGGCLDGECLPDEDVLPVDAGDLAAPDVQGPDSAQPDELEQELPPELIPCVDECQQGDFYCSGIKVYHGCVEGDDGCLHVDEAGIPCEDGNPCTDDACALGKGCVTADNTEPCDDGNPCTQDDKCGSGQCQPGNNACQCATDADCNLLDDQDKCNGDLVCTNNQCVTDPNTVITCPADPADPCLHYACEANTGKCNLVPTAQATCDDKNLCTVGDFCDQGQCIAESEVICDDLNACTGDSCLPAQGCVFAPTNGVACEDDGNPCTTDYCQNAGCIHPAMPDNTGCGGGKVCKNGQCVTLDCNPACGQCQQCSNGLCVAFGDGNACADDGNVCTNDLCSGGSCTHPAASYGTGCADDSNACTEDFCSSGSCTHPAKSDGTSCGAGMECQGGVCKQSSAPVELAGSLNSPWNLAIDDQNVYFVENKSSGGTVKKVPKAGGGVVTLSTGLVEPTAIGVDAGQVYFIERNNGSNGTLKKVSTGGGGTTTLASGLKNAQNHLAVFGDSVYFGDGKAGGGGVIKKVGINGGETILVQGNGLLNLNTAIDVSGGSVYFKNDYDKILRVATSGGGVTELGSGAPSALKVWGSFIFYTEYSNAMIKQMPIGGGGSTTLASGANSAAGLATDGSYVYWTEFNNPGKVARVPVGGGATKTYSTQANSIGIAVDGQYVYYTISVYTNQGKVMRAPK